MILSAPPNGKQKLTVRYLVRVREGDVYRVGKLEVDGLDERDTAKVRERLKLRSGDVYDENPFYRGSELSKWSLGRKVEIALTKNDERKIVDIALRFRH